MTDNIVQSKRDKNQNSDKLHLDKYYTSDETAQGCITLALDILESRNNIITEIIEPSAGNGVFSNKLDNCIAYDLEPEHQSIIKQDFLLLDIPYKQGRLFIGNPPYGSRNGLSVKFFKKCIGLGDYIAFILPISQLNNTQQMYEFDLVYSGDLGKLDYSGRKIHCCFNIYVRPENGLNKLPRNDRCFLELIEVRESIKNKNPKRNRIVKDFDYDIAICAWGAAVGKELEYEGQYVKEFYIKVINEKYKDRIVDLIRHAKWTEIYPMTAVPNLLHWQVYKYVNEQVEKWKEIDGLDNN